MQSLLNAVEQALIQNADTFTNAEWHLRRIYGGMNGIIYRAEDAHHADSPLAVKIRKRDERQRAWREFSVLQALKQASQSIAPEPISLHVDLPALPGDVVISSWIEGQVLNDLSQAEFAVWERVLTALAQCHSLTPSDAPHLIDAVLPIRSTVEVVADIERRYAKLPDGQIGELAKTEIKSLFDEFKRDPRNIHPPTQQIGLITCDTNPSNMIDSEGRIVIVDWENAGWGDPAFDVADLLVRPNCANLSREMHTRIISRYTEMMDRPRWTERILAYERLMLIFWLILTSNGFTVDPSRFPGTRQFTLEQTRQQQIAYIQRIEAKRSNSGSY